MTENHCSTSSARADGALPLLVARAQRHRDRRRCGAATRCAAGRRLQSCWGRLERAQTLLNARISGADTSPLGTVFFRRLPDRPAAELLCAARSAVGEAARRLRRSCGLLGTIGSLAPFIGLLGTSSHRARFRNMAASGGWVRGRCRRYADPDRNGGRFAVGSWPLRIQPMQVRIGSLAANGARRPGPAHSLARATRVPEAMPRVVQSR